MNKDRDRPSQPSAQRLGERPPDRLPQPAHAAWLRYVRMVESKDTHFAYLEVLDAKYQNGGKRTLAEISHLDGLLQQHNACVQAFSQSVKTLAARDHNSHQSLLDLIIEFNLEMGTLEGKH